MCGVSHLSKRYAGTAPFGTASSCLFLVSRFSCILILCVCVCMEGGVAMRKAVVVIVGDPSKHHV